ncbi:MAG: DUF3105 domain-containing protein [Actinobacteria bacterium]|nr:DUF3105 domain-containing protein [Actinomycetota bacterium]
MRGAPWVAALAVLATGLPGCGDGDAQVACGAVEHPEVQAGSHLIGGATPPVPYSSTPGTSGWHAAGAPRTGVFGAADPLSEPEIVKALEVGQVVAAYDPTRLAADATAQLEELAHDRFAGALTVTPFSGDLGAPLVLNAWGVRQPCTGVDADAIGAFVEEHAEPHPH